MENINQENIENTGLIDTIPTSELSIYTPNNPPWNSLTAFFFWLASVALIFIFPMLFIGPYLLYNKDILANSENAGKFLTSDPTALFLQIASIIPAHIITLIIAWFIVTKYKKYSFREMLGWDFGGFNWWQTSLIMVGILVLVFLTAIVTNQIFGQQDNDFLKLLRSSRYIVFIVAFMATFSAPIVEEVIYRGILYSAFQRTFNIPIAVLLVTGIFALVHFPQYWGDSATLITLTFLSLLITLLRVKTGSLLPCILIHFLINGIQSVVLILQPYLPESLDATKIEGFFYFLR